MIERDADTISLERVVLITAIRPNARDYNRHGVAFFRSRGIEVVWLDVTDICHPYLEAPETGETFPGGVTVRRITNVAALNDEEETLRKADLVLALFTNGLLTQYNYPVFRLMTRAATPYAFLMNDVFPGANQYKGEVRNLPKRIAHVFSRLASLDWKTSLLVRLPFAWLGLRQADFVIHGGRKSVTTRPSIGGKTLRIFAHAHDYENFRNEKDEEAAADNAPTAVFIDQDVFRHHDFTLYPGFSLGSPEEYYRGLNTLFDRIERELGLEVVIAAHPRSDYEKAGNPFSGRRIVEGETHRLVRDGRLAMTFSSQAMNYAILYGKPVVILSTRDFYRHPCGKSYQDPMADSVGRPVFFLEEAARNDLGSLLSVDRPLYDRYIADYIKIPESKDAPLWETAMQEISRHSTGGRQHAGAPTDVAASKSEMDTSLV